MSGFFCWTGADLVADAVASEGRHFTDSSFFTMVAPPS